MGSEKTVVIGLNWVGDNVLALPTYRALHHRFRNEGGIAIAAPENVASLLGAAGVARRIVAWNHKTRDRVSALRRGNFRRAIILPNSFRAAAVTYAAGITERWGYDTDLRSLLLTNTVPTVAYRGGKAVRGAPGTFATFSPDGTARTPAKILAHIGDLYDWALSQAKGAEAWNDSTPLEWDREVERFVRPPILLGSVGREIF